MPSATEAFLDAMRTHATNLTNEFNEGRAEAAFADIGAKLNDLRALWHPAPPVAPETAPVPE